MAVMETSEESPLQGVSSRAARAEARLQHWRSNVPIWCDIDIATEDSFMEWPSLTIDWLHGSSTPLPTLPAWTRHLLVLGTMTDGQDPNYLLLYSSLMPTSNPTTGIGALPSSGEVPPTDATGGEIDQLVWPEGYQCFDLFAKIPHPGNVDRARSMPQRGTVIATKSVTTPGVPPALYIYDVAPHLSEPGGGTAEAERDGSAEGSEGVAGASGGPALSCRSGPAPSAGGLCWSPTQEGTLLSACEAGRLTVFQLDAPALAGTSPTGIGAGAGAGAGGAGVADLAPSAVFRGHSDCLVNDAAFAPGLGAAVFASVAEDGTAALWDWRCRGSSGTAGRGGGGDGVAGLGPRPGPASAPVRQWQAHFHKGVGSGAPANGISFSPLREALAATCGADGTVKVWDLRQGRSGGQDGGTAGAVCPVQVLRSHRCPVTQVSWSPHSAPCLASCDRHGFVYVWNLERGPAWGTYGRDHPPASAPDGGSAGAQVGGQRGLKRRQAGVDPLPARPELRVIFAGHAREVNDLAWCPDAMRGAGMVATVSSGMWFDDEGGEEGEDGEGRKGLGERGQAVRTGEEGEDGEQRGPVAVQFPSLQVWRPSADLI